VKRNDIINEARLLEITQNIQAKYACHTIILYGSRARGESTNSSDYDIIAIREQGDFERDCGIFDDFYLDVFVYSEEAIKNPDASLIRIKDGVVLFQKDHIGDSLLNTIKGIFQKGAPKTPAWEKHEIINWTRKMLQRAQESDVEGNFRKHWLLYDLLECYFKMRDRWYLGPKESFQWLKVNDPNIYSAFEVALKANSTFNEIENLINNVAPLGSEDKHRME